LEEWDWREVRALGVEENWVRFGNEFWDMYNCAFPVAKRRKRDVEKPWLDDVDFKELVREKGELYSRKIRRKLREGRLAEVTKEVRGREVRGSYWGLESYLGHSGGGFGGEKKGWDWVCLWLFC
jgi:hypothetical protein